jgi:hypothetical protein
MCARDELTELLKGKSSFGKAVRLPVRSKSGDVSVEDARDMVIAGGVNAMLLELSLYGNTVQHSRGSYTYFITGQAQPTVGRLEGKLVCGSAQG